ncbi:MAG: general secretion pathway protein GspD [Methylophaga sp.]|nr:general secretion pathway protein GspD [Methylophaga sp.]
MKKMCSVTYLLFFYIASFSAFAGNQIKELEFADTQLTDVIRTLSELSNSNVIATPAATKNKVTIRLRNVSVLDAIKSISRITNLWYRYDDDTKTYRIMTREEYGKDLIIRESENIEVFHLLNANVQIIAQAIQDLYGNRVILSLGRAAGQSGKNVGSSNARRGGGGVRNSRSTAGRANRSNRANRRNSGAAGAFATGGNQLLSSRDLTVDQIEQLSSSLEGQTVNTEILQQVTVNAQPIYITVNNEHSMIIVRTDDQKVLKSIDSLINKMDIPIPQVMLEMKILNITLGEDFNSIFNFELQPSGGNQSLQPIKIGNNALLNSGSYIYEFLNSRLRANIEFLEQNKRIKVLSNPMVLASNHRQAELFIGEESLLTRGFIFNPAVITNGVVVSPSYVETETEVQEIGITLRITPRINADGTVALDLEQENSTLKPGGATLPISDGAGSVLNLPIDTVETARLTGTVVARDNLTVAVGGLIRNSKVNNEKKVPILSEIPVIGRIFRTTIESEQNTETVLLITPHILNKPQDSEKLRQADNQFYQSYNDGFPDLAPFPNKFIDKEPLSSSNNKANKSQKVYLEMSQYAADTIRIAEIDRKLDPKYFPDKVKRVAVTNLFDNNQIKVMPLASWNRGGMYVTAVELVNKANSTLPVDYKKIKGK